MRKIKIDIGVIGRFHAFNMARYFQDHNILNNLFTTLPLYKVKSFGLREEYISTSIYCEVFVRIIRRIGLINRYPKLIYIYHRWFIRVLTNHIETTHATIFIGFSGVSLDAIRIAKKKKMLTIVERGSCHRTKQMDLLKEEYDFLGLKKHELINGVDEVYFREILEYDEADYISVPSTFAKKTFIEQGIDESKLIVNPYGVDLSEFKVLPKSDDIFRVIYCGRLSIQKGSHYLLQAMHELKLNNFEFWHIGSIDEEMKFFVDKFHSEKFIYKGTYKQRDLHKLYAEGSVFILPSIQDGFGMVLFQAMACGLPIIATENTGGPDLVTRNGEEGYIIPIRSVKAIQSKLLYMYNNPKLLNNMGIKARLRVENGFSWSDYGDRYMENLKKIVKNEI